MKETLNDSFNNFDTIMRNNNFGILPSSPSPFNPQNISYYHNELSPNNEKESDKQESHSNIKIEEETPQLNLKFEQNTPTVEENEKSNDNDNNKEIPRNTGETKNTSSIISNRIEVVPTIQNIVCTANLNCKLNLKEIALQANNVKYEPKKFTGLIMKIKKPKATALIFPNGKIVCLGTKNEQEAKLACRKFAKIIAHLQFDVKLRNIRIQNIVGSYDMNFEIPLSALYFHIKLNTGSTVAYEPEQFPGLIYHYLLPNKEDDDENSKNPNIVFLIFHSGKIVIAGAKKINQINEAFSQVYTLLHKFKGRKK